jgi:hypothetical protein
MNAETGQNYFKKFGGRINSVRTSETIELDTLQVTY